MGWHKIMGVDLSYVDYVFLLMKSNSTEGRIDATYLYINTLFLLKGLQSFFLFIVVIFAAVGEYFERLSTAAYSRSIIVGLWTVLE